MKYKYLIISLVLSVFILSGCNDRFGEKLFGPESTVAPEVEQIQNISFVNVTNNTIENAKAISASTYIDVIFSSQVPIGSSQEILVSAKSVASDISSSTVFNVSVVNDESVQESFFKLNGYRVNILPAENYSLKTSTIAIEKGKKNAISSAVLKIFNTENLVLDKDYVIALRIEPVEGFEIAKDNQTLFIHIKRKGGSGEVEGAAVFLPMKGDNTLDSEGLDLGINRNNLYYSTPSTNFRNLNIFTIEGLIYVDSFKPESEQLNGALGSISSLWGNESYGSPVKFLLRFGDAGVKPNKLQLITNDDKKVVNYSFKENKWYHVAVTVDKDKKVTVYVNGREKLSFVSPDPVSLSGSLPFTLGYSFNQWRGFNGMMSQVRIWNIARNSKDLRKNALDIIDFESERDNLVAYWKMNKASEDKKEIEDATGNGNNLKVGRSGASSSIEPNVIIDNNIDIKL